MILSESEKNDLLKVYSHYSIEPKNEVESNWVSRKFPSTQRVARLSEHKDKSASLHQIC